MLTIIIEILGMILKNILYEKWWKWEMHKWDQMKTKTNYKTHFFRSLKWRKYPIWKTVMRGRKITNQDHILYFFVSIFTNQSHAIGYSRIILVVVEFFIYHFMFKFWMIISILVNLRPQTKHSTISKNWLTGMFGKKIKEIFNGYWMVLTHWP